MSANGPCMKMTPLVGTVSKISMSQEKYFGFSAQLAIRAGTMPLAWGLLEQQQELLREAVIGNVAEAAPQQVILLSLMSRHLGPQQLSPFPTRPCLWNHGTQGLGLLKGFQKEHAIWQQQN